MRSSYAKSMRKVLHATVGFWSAAALFGCGGGGGSTSGGAGGSGAGGGLPHGDEWAVNFGETGDSDLVVMTSTPSSEVIFAGVVAGTVDFGSGSVGHAGAASPDAWFLVKLDATGNVAWSKHGDGHPSFESLGSDSAGNIVMSLATEEKFDLGGLSIPASGSSTRIIARLDPDGKPLWMSPLSGSVGYGSLAVDLDGSIVLGGSFDSQAAINGSSFGIPSGEQAIVAKLDANGKPLWYHGTSSASVFAVKVAINAQHRIAAFGITQGTIDLGGGVTAGTDGNAKAPFYEGFDATGALLASKGYAPQEDLFFNYMYRIAEDASGGLIIAAQLESSGFDFGEGPLLGGATVGCFVARLDNTGTLAWTRKYLQPSAGVFFQDVAVDPDDNVLLAGGYYGTVDFGDGKKDPGADVGSGAGKGSLVKLDPSGAFLSSYRYDAFADHVAGGASGRVILAGAMTNVFEDADLNGTKLVRKSMKDVFVASFTQ